MSWVEDPGVTAFGAFNITELNVDEAWLNVSSSYASSLWLYELSSNCHQCPYERRTRTGLLPGDSQVFKILTQFTSKYRLRFDGTSRWVSQSESERNILCEVESLAGEFGVYALAVSDEAKCSITTRLEPVNIYYPLIVVTLFYLCLVISILLWKNYGLKTVAYLKTICGSRNEVEGYRTVTSPSPSTEPSSSGTLKKRRKVTTKSQVTGTAHHQNTTVQTTETNILSESNSPKTSSGKRLQSIDTFRGICIAIMIFADDGGGLYPFLEHCTWNGLYVADLAFPWFLWIMGTCIPISIQSQKSRGDTKQTIFKKILFRSLKLILLGLAMNTSSSPHPVALSKLRLPGVLQRFGICYFTASTMFLFLVAIDTLPHSRSQEPQVASNPSLLKDFKILFIPWMIIPLVVMTHSLITFFLPVPDCPTGYLGPAGLHLENKYPSVCIGGSAGYIDRVVFSENHMYSRPTAKRVYKTGSYDPEGLLGILTSLFQVWLGVHTGTILLTFTQTWSRIKRMWAWAVISGAMGSVICGGIANTGWIPVNKNLWSLSYVFVTSSLAWILLSFLYFIVDVKKVWSGAPFFQAGMNSILLYIGHDITQSMIPWNYSFGLMNTHLSHLMESLWGTSLWMILSIYLYDHKLFWVLN